MQTSRSIARRVLLHPLLWAVILLAAAVPLMGTPFDFGGFLLALLSGWMLAHALVRRLLALDPPWLSVLLHVVASLVVVAPLLALTDPGPWRQAFPPELVAAVGFALPPAAGWIWLTLIGRVSGAVRADADRRAARLIEPEWARDAAGWSLRLPVVPLRRSTYLVVAAGLIVLAGALIVTFVVVFADLAQRMGPMAILLVLGWTVFLPVFLVLQAIARARTVDVSIVVDPRRVRVLPADGGPAMVDAPLRDIRSLTWRLRSSPTGLTVRMADGTGVVLLVGMARRAKGRAPTFPAPPASLLGELASTGLSEKTSRRPRAEEFTLERAAVPAGASASPRHGAGG